MPEQQWKDVVGYEGRYQVSDMGEVRSVGRTVSTRGRYGPMTRRIVGRTLKPVHNPYPRVILFGADGKKWKYVHHLVAEAFIGPRPDGMLVLHDDDVPTNNVVANLSYGTPSKNNRDAVRNERHAMALRTECPQGHPYSGTNLKVIDGRRYCRDCTNRHNRAYRARKALEGASK